MARLVEGTVEMRVNDALDDDEVAEGWILTCQSVPTSDDRARPVRIRGLMDQQQIADIIEIEQLLARYAVGMTQDDIDAVIEVFTPDGSYSAFGDTYALADFPRLVAAAPKGLFLTGPPMLDLARRRGHRRADAVLRRPDRPRHAHRLVHGHLPADRGGLAPADPVDDLPAAQRRPATRASRTTRRAPRPPASEPG